MALLSQHAGRRELTGRISLVRLLRCEEEIGRLTRAALFRVMSMPIKGRSSSCWVVAPEMAPAQARAR